MSNYIFAFHGGKKPESPEEGAKVMAKWGAWMGQLGAAIVNPGGPLGDSHTVSSSGVAENGGSNPVSGFTLIEADSLAAAIEMSKGCPILDDDGTVEVAEMLPM
jgi:hypothetical protein